MVNAFAWNPSRENRCVSLRVGVMDVWSAGATRFHTDLPGLYVVVLKQSKHGTWLSSETGKTTKQRFFSFFLSNSHELFIEKNRRNRWQSSMGYHKFKINQNLPKKWIGVNKLIVSLRRLIGGHPFPRKGNNNKKIVFHQFCDNLYKEISWPKMKWLELFSTQHCAFGATGLWILPSFQRATTEHNYIENGLIARRRGENKTEFDHENGR